MASEEYLDELRDRVLETIAEIRQRHERELAPFYEQLANIQRCRRPYAVTLTVAEAVDAGFIQESHG